MARNEARLRALTRDLNDAAFAVQAGGELMKLAMRDLHDRTLASLDGLFNQLMYVAGLREGVSESDEYRHDGLAAVYGESVADQVLRETHVEIWTRWVECGLDEQSSELDKHLRRSGARVLLDWNDDQFVRLTPPSMPSILEHHFRTNLQMLIDLRVRAMQEGEE